jgi:hypothetical protein
MKCVTASDVERVLDERLTELEGDELGRVSYRLWFMSVERLASCRAQLGQLEREIQKSELLQKKASRASNQ